MIYKQIRSFMPCIAIIVIGCAAGQIVPASTANRDYVINFPRQKIIDAAIVVAQMQNLNVAVLEKQYGLIGFEAASLSTTQLDKYCEYPAINPKTGQAWDTFANWNLRSVKDGSGSLFGSVSITLLISDGGSKSNVNLKSNWTAYNNTESSPCNSNGRFETEFIDALKNRLQKSLD